VDFADFVHFGTHFIVVANDYDVAENEHAS